MNEAKKIHRHNFFVSDNKTLRICKSCGCRQAKVSGKWKLFK